MGVSEEHKQVAKKLEDQLLSTRTNSTVIPIEQLYELAGRERLTEKFYSGVTEAAETRHLLISFGENVVVVTRDVAP